MQSHIASKNPALPSMFDGIGMGLGFTCAITILGAIRELLGGGTILSTGSSALVDLSTLVIHQLVYLSLHLVHSSYLLCA